MQELAEVLPPIEDRTRDRDVSAPAQPAIPLGLAVRKVVVHREAVLTEAGAAPTRPAVRASAAAVITNPWRGTPARTDLSQAVAVLAPPLAKLLTDALIDALGGVEEIEAFGKAAIVGTGGELEHGAALIHTPYFGNLVRSFLGGESIICFADTRADAGQMLVVPLWHKTQASTRSHYQTMTTRVPDAPRADEIVVVAAASTGPRPHARIGDRSTDPEITAAVLDSAVVDSTVLDPTVLSTTDVNATVSEDQA
ncbi:amino acid synthesis family protein [Kineococcus sp. SYSU DK003]|uniref:amino acid synthesis family protein n=1 Tax=Kineococcus sp. SYSU DK003 TaxID=3383124 RepID=UPI003D7E3DA0